MQRQEEHSQSKAAGSKTALLLDLGLQRDYGKVWQLQKTLVEQRKAGRIPDALIVVEHDHVLTLGRSSHLQNVLLKDLPIFEIERGGDVTYHGPGQLVMYPILSLEERGLGVRQYVESLEQSLVQALLLLGITEAVGKLGAETGVWVGGRRKIASIGVAVAHWITYHGFALNVNTDLSYFQKIRPCGFDAGVMTSLAQELRLPQIEMASVKEKVLAALAVNFEWTFEPRCSPESLRDGKEF